MKSCNHLKRLAAVLAWILGIYTVLAVLPSGPAKAMADNQEEFYKTSASVPASPSVANPTEEPEPPSVASPSAASPSQAPLHITYVDSPRLIALDAFEAGSSDWRNLLPERIEANTDHPEGKTVWCDISWSVSDVIWDQPGVYSAHGQLTPPDGYIFDGYEVPYFDTVISIHPPGTAQVMDIYIPLGYFGQMGHTWTFAMNTEQDITPLVETLQGMTNYFGLLDTRDTIQFTAEWDFSEVDTTRPGIYRIYRRLELVEESLPPELDLNQIYIPEYWKTLPVLLSVEEPGKPELYGVLENPREFFGSYASLSDEEYEALEVWYSMDGGPWTLQTDEMIMETDYKNYYIYKDKLEDGIPCSFYLKLGEHTSRILTVQKGTPLVWFLWTLDGNRDGTVDVDFPSFSQPPPDSSEEETTEASTEESPGNGTADPTEGSTEDGSADPTEGSTEDGSSDPTEGSTEDGSSNPTEGSTEDGSSGPTEGSTEDGSSGPTEGSTEDGSSGSTEDSTEDGSSGPANSSANGTTAGSTQGEDSPKELPAFSTQGEPAAPPASGNTGDSPSSGAASGPDASAPSDIPVSAPSAGTSPESSTSAQAGGISRESGSAKDTAPGPTQATEAGSSLMPMELVDQWTTQISGKRVKKLLELYPDHIVFQKESVSVLVSSDWLKELNLKDSDILTIQISPEEGHEVTILINQKTPLTSPVYQIKLLDSVPNRTGGLLTGAVFTLIILILTGSFLIRRRK